jgi:hypothetical protein
MAIYVTFSSTVGLTSDPLYALQPTGSLAAFSAAGAPLPVTSSAFRSAAFFLLGCLRVAIVAVYIFVPGTVCSLYVLTYLLLLWFNPAFCSLPRSCVLFFMNSLLVSSLNILRTALLLCWFCWFCTYIGSWYCMKFIRTYSVVGRLPRYRTLLIA